MAKSIFFEGIDGTGKSTLTKALKEHLEATGKQVITLREPGGSAYYEAIREHIHFQQLDRTPLSDALTCAGGIAENIRQTKKALSEDIWVITDRSYISNAVYQAAQGLDLALAEKINALALDGFTYDLRILLDMPLDQASARLSSIGKKKDRWETMGDDYFRTIQKLYQDIAKREQMTVLDASESVDKLIAQIMPLI